MTTSGGSPTEPLLGTWRMTYTCEKFARAFDAAGLGDLAARWIVAVGLEKGQADRSSHGGNVCAGAKRFTTTVHFRPNGYLIRYNDDEMVSDCHCYLLVDAHTFVNLGDPGEPDTSLRFTIRGDELHFRVVIPDPCTTPKCRDAVAYSVGAYGLGSWRRID